MSTSSFKDALAASGPDRPRSPMLTRAQRLALSMPPAVVELLEVRRLMALTHGLNGSTLEITGTVNADTIVVSMDAGIGSLRINDGTGNLTPAYDPNQISLIKIVAGSGADSIFISSDTAAGTNVGESTLIYGDADNDTISGGNWSDTVYGGTGDDQIWTYIDNDRVYAGAGADTVHGGNDADVLVGEDDADLLDGESGSDQIYGGNGNDTILCGAGTDRAYGDAGDDSLSDGLGPDTLYGGTGDDIVDAEFDTSADFFFGGADVDTLIGAGMLDTSSEFEA